MIVLTKIDRLVAVDHPHLRDEAVELAPALVAALLERESRWRGPGRLGPGERMRGGAVTPMVYDFAVTALKAHIVNGRIVVDEPVDLPDGAEIHVYLYDASAEAISADERAALERALERGLEQADAGELVEADDVLAELQRP